MFNNMLYQYNVLLCQYLSGNMHSIESDPAAFQRCRAAHGERQQ
jgi:hypothetical protein